VGKWTSGFSLLDGSSFNDPDGTISDPIAIGWLWKKKAQALFFLNNNKNYQS
jgi:hypothetical protein